MFNPIISYWYSYICKLNSNNLFCIFFLLYVALFNLFYYFYWIGFSIFFLCSYCLKSYKMYFYCFSGYPSIWNHVLQFIGGFPSGTLAKNPPASAGDAGLIPGFQKIPWRRKQQSTPVFLPGKSHGQGSLGGYSPWGHKRVGYNLATKQPYV